jgi:hypothetical protein
MNELIAHGLKDTMRANNYSVIALFYNVMDHIGHIKSFALLKMEPNIHQRPFISYFPIQF